MKAVLALALSAILTISTAFPNPEYLSDKDCYYKNHKLIKGPKGGCYYINSNGNKTYVERSYCDC